MWHEAKAAAQRWVHERVMPTSACRMPPDVDEFVGAQHVAMPAAQRFSAWTLVVRADAETGARVDHLTVMPSLVATLRS